MMHTLREAIRRAIGRPPALPLVYRWHLEAPSDCIAFIARHVSEVAAARSGGVLLIGDDDAHRRALTSEFKSKGVEVTARSPTDIEPPDPAAISCVTTSHFDARTVESIGRSLLASESLRAIPFEYILSRSNYEGFERHDPDYYRGFYFISPLLGDEIDYLGIYQESLERFELKCDVRDYLEICQMIREVVLNKVPGDIAEFGSYKGHSGYLISRLLEAHGSDKTLHMFDTFEAFPAESLGVDSFWSATHAVNFEEVSAKFSGRANVRLVRGDFERTVPRELPQQVAMAYIDCDSYRATKLLVGALYDHALPSGGLMAFEDYGHPALLGNRLAVDELFAARPACFRYFSPFSGIYIVRKT